MNNYYGIACVLGVMLITAISYAYAQESDWRIINKNAPELVPMVSQTVSPFYRSKEHSSLEISPTETITAEQLEQQKRLNIYTKIVSNNEVVKPDLPSLKINGYLSGNNSKSKVLVADRWYGVGEQILVPGKLNPELYKFIGTVSESLLPEEQQLINQIKKQLHENKKIIMEVDSVKPGLLRLRSRYGHVYSQSWQVRR